MLNCKFSDEFKGKYLEIGKKCCTFAPWHDAMGNTH